MSLQRAERACLLRNTAGTDRQDVSCRAENACVTVRRWPRPRERSSTRKRKKKKNRRDTTIKRADPGGWSRAGTRDRLLPDCWHGGHDTGVSTSCKTELSSMLLKKCLFPRTVSIVSFRGYCPRLYISVPRAGFDDRCDQPQIPAIYLSVADFDVEPAIRYSHHPTSFNIFEVVQMQDTIVELWSLLVRPVFLLISSTIDSISNEFFLRSFQFWYERGGVGRPCLVE